jgi:hypothetical protein
MRTSPDEYLNGDHRYSSHDPGEGRGPGGRAPVWTGGRSLSFFPDWAPAFAGAAVACGEAIA